MADIAITANDQGLFTITLDVWEWTSLVVNGVIIPKYNGPLPGVQFQYVQTIPGNVAFQAYANPNLVPLNPPIIKLLQGTQGGQNETYVLNFSAIPLANQTACYGFMTMEAGFAPNSEQSPLLFSQGRMTGKFVFAK